MIRDTQLTTRPAATSAIAHGLGDRYQRLRVFAIICRVRPKLTSIEAGTQPMFEDEECPQPM